MAIQQRLTFNLTDLSKVRLVCRKCKVELAYPLDAKALPRPPSRCPDCLEEWYDSHDRPFNTTEQPVLLALQLLSGIRELAALDDGLTFDIRLEIERSLPVESSTAESTS